MSIWPTLRKERKKRGGPRDVGNRGKLKGPRDVGEVICFCQSWFWSIRKFFFKCNYKFQCGILLLQEIKKNLPKSDLIMIEEGISIHDVGFITFSLSREWMAKVFFFLFFSGAFKTYNTVFT